MKSGIELIADERRDQLEKHGFTVEKDVELNLKGELICAAKSLCIEDLPEDEDDLDLDDYRPFSWNAKAWEHMAMKPYKERLAIAGALIAAEIDRLQAIE